MEEKLKLNDGTEFGNHSHALQSGDNLFVYISDGSDIKTVFEAFIEPEKTKRIEYVYFGSVLTFDGFTKLVAVRDEGNGLITANLYIEPEPEAP